MFNQSVILRTYMHLFNNIVLVLAVTAMLIILTVFPLFITFCFVKKYMVIK